MSQPRLAALDRIRALIEIMLGMKEGMRIGPVAPAHGRVMAEAGPSFGREFGALSRIMSRVKKLVRPVTSGIADFEIVRHGAEPGSARLGVVADIPAFVEEPANGRKRCGIER
jgi:hypothetical protein